MFEATKIEHLYIDPEVIEKLAKKGFKEVAQIKDLTVAQIKKDNPRIKGVTIYRKMILKIRSK